MVRDIDHHCTEGHEPMSARIGMSMGKVVVGALGSLQPRLHIRGGAMRLAEKLEQQGTPGMVHVCDKFMELVCGRDCLRNAFQSVFVAQPSSGAKRDGVTDISSIDISSGGHWDSRATSPEWPQAGRCVSGLSSCTTPRDANGKETLVQLHNVAQAISKELRWWNVVHINMQQDISRHSGQNISGRTADSFLLQQMN
jgi:hypothetical protein